MDERMKKMTSFFEACKPVTPTNTAVVTQKELNVLVTLFKTEMGGVDKPLMKKYCDRLKVNFLTKLPNNIDHD